MLTILALIITAHAEKFTIVGCSKGSVIRVSEFSTPYKECFNYEESVEKVYRYTGSRRDERLFMNETLADFNEYLKRKRKNSYESDEFSSDIKIEDLEPERALPTQAEWEAAASLSTPVDDKKLPSSEKNEVPMTTTKSTQSIKKQPVKAVEDDSLFIEAAAAAAEKSKQHDVSTMEHAKPTVPPKEEDNSEEWFIAYVMITCAVNWFFFRLDERNSLMPWVVAHPGFALAWMIFSYPGVLIGAIALGALLVFALCAPIAWVIAWFIS